MYILIGSFISLMTYFLFNELSEKWKLSMLDFIRDMVISICGALFVFLLTSSLIHGLKLKTYEEVTYTHSIKLVSPDVTTSEDPSVVKLNDLNEDLYYVKVYNDDEEIYELTELHNCRIERGHKLKLEERVVYHTRSDVYCLLWICENIERISTEYVLLLPDDVPISHFNFDVVDIENIKDD